MKKFRIGFLIDDLSPSSQCNELIEFVKRTEIFDTPVLITGYKNNIQQSFFKKFFTKLKQGPFKFFKSAIRVFLIKIITKIELKNAKKRFPKYRVNYEIKNLNKFKVIRVEGKWSKSRRFLEMTNEDLNLISNYNLDCIIRCGSGILKGGILDITRFGVISFHHGDNRTNRGGPPGFWEVLNGEPSSGFIIQRLNNELDGGYVLFRGNMMTSDLWLANHAQLLDKSNIFMMKFLLELAESNRLPVSEGVRLHGNKLYKLDSIFILIKYFIKIIFPKILNSLLSKLASPKVTRWSIAYCYHNEFSKSLWRYKEIKNPKGRFLADPFVIENRGETFIFVEDLLYKENKGRISAIKLNRDNYEFLGVVLEEDFHLSFPFIFREGDDVYMIPESSNNFDIRLYKSIDFPLKWEFKKQLMTNVDAADTMLFKNDGTWFMLTNLCSAKIKDHQSELHIFHSENFNDAKWMPIKEGNPVIFDPLKGRNGGFFTHKGKFYRVSQSHKQAHYGESFSVNEIITISKEKYVEKQVSIIGPNFKDSTISTHHFHANTKTAVIDFARYQRLKKVFNT